MRLSPFAPVFALALPLKVVGHFPKVMGSWTHFWIRVRRKLHANRGRLSMASADETTGGGGRGGAGGAQVGAAAALRARGGAAAGGPGVCKVFISLDHTFQM